VLENGFENINGASADVEFQEFGSGLKIAQIGHEVAQAE